MVNRSETDRRVDPDKLDRILLGACAAIWLTALGAAVAATVALVDLGTGDSEPSDGAGTPWLLYSVIGISAVVIIGAVPLLIRARNAAVAEPPPPARSNVARPKPKPAPGAVRGGEAPTEKLRTAAAPARASLNRFGSSGATAAIDALWLRCAVVIVSAMGLATLAISIGTYLMAVDSDSAAWVAYAFTALVTLAMPAIPWFYLRELRAVS